MVPATVARPGPIGLGLHRVIWIDLPVRDVGKEGKWEPIGTAEPDQAERSDADDLLGGLGAQVGQLATPLRLAHTPSTGLSSGAYGGRNSTTGCRLQHLRARKHNDLGSKAQVRWCVAPAAGLEPATISLTGRCSAD
jgi:hypothetical protein